MLVRGMRSLCLLALVVAAGSCASNESPTGPGGGCGLPALINPPASVVCALPAVVSGCPDRRPEGARTLVNVATCDYATGTQPCTPRNTLCPLVNPDGNEPQRFLVPGADACSGVVDVLLQATQGEGGAGVEWRAQDYVRSGSTCVPQGRLRIGLASVSGSCCSTTLEVPFPERRRTFRFIAQTDWTR